MCYAFVFSFVCVNVHIRRSVSKKKWLIFEISSFSLSVSYETPPAPSPLIAQPVCCVCMQCSCNKNASFRLFPSFCWLFFISSCQLCVAQQTCNMHTYVGLSLNFFVPVFFYYYFILFFFYVVIDNLQKSLTCLLASCTHIILYIYIKICTLYANTHIHTYIHKDHYFCCLSFK